MFLKSPFSPFDLFDSVIRLRDGGVVDPSSRMAIADLGSTTEWTVVGFRAESDEAVHTDVWERHPAGQELLCLLSGALTVHLRDAGDGTEPTATVSAGECLVIPAGRWHRLSVVRPAELMAITPPAGTAHEPVSRPESLGED